MDGGSDSFRQTDVSCPVCDRQNHDWVVLLLCINRMFLHAVMAPANRGSAISSFSASCAIIVVASGHASRLALWDIRLRELWSFTSESATFEASRAPSVKIPAPVSTTR